MARRGFRACPLGPRGDLEGDQRRPGFRGNRGLPGGSSLARLLAEHRGARNPKDLPPLTIEQILAWADAHRAATGRWPVGLSGPVAEGSEETWAVVNKALCRAAIAACPAARRWPACWRSTGRCDRGGCRCGRSAPGPAPTARPPAAGPMPTPAPCAASPTRTGRRSMPRLKFGRRGLPGGSSLTALFGRSLDPAAQGIRPELTVEQVLAWADAHRAATGRWPTITSGPVAGVPGEKWVNLDAALRLGRRGLPSGTNLTRLIAEHRGAPGQSLDRASRKLCSGQNS